MKRLLTIFGIFSVAVLCLLLYLWLRQSPAEGTAAEEEAGPQQVAHLGVAPRETIPTADEAEEVRHAERGRLALEAIERARDEWRTPIEFYGLVVDELGQPVEGAEVDFACNDLSAEGTSFYHTVSDNRGLFSITGIRGKLLTVEVTKSGYYTSERDNTSFYYSGQNQNFKPHPNRPVTFHLRKRGEATPLTVWNATHSVSVSGKPLYIDIRTGKATGEGDGSLVVEYVKGSVDASQGRRYDWRFKLSVPGGGLVLSTNEFDFIAPAGGYQTADEVVMDAQEGDWRARMNRQYFVKLPDGNFARVVLDLMAHNGSLRIHAFLNPHGSRNLEYDESVQPKETFFE